MPFWKKNSNASSQSKSSFRQKLRRSKPPSGDSRDGKDGSKPVAASAPPLPPPELVPSKQDAAYPATSGPEELRIFSPDTQKAEMTQTTIATMALEVAPANVAPKTTKTTVALALAASPKPTLKEAPTVVEQVAEVFTPTHLHPPTAQPRNPVPAPKPPHPSSGIQLVMCYCRHRSNSCLISKRPISTTSACSGCGRCCACTPEILPETRPRCNKCHTKSHLLTLPIELHEMISTYLDIPETWLLRLTSKYFFTLLPAPIGPMTRAQLHTFYSRIHPLIPPPLLLCARCIRWHPSTPEDSYTWFPPGGLAPQRFCLRDLDRTGRQPQDVAFSLGDRHFVCRHCLLVRRNRQCRACAKCEVCAGVTFSILSVECIECDAGKTRCTQCRRVRVPRPGCEKCGRCERCAECLFQFGDRVCRACGGAPLSDGPRSRRVRVEQGPGYEIFYQDPTASLGMPERRIGVRM